MTVRTTLTQGVQIGVETTPGTAVAASKRLQSVSIAPAAKPSVKTFRPMGNKYPTVAALGKDMSEASIEGQPTYDEIIYMLSSVLTTGVVTTPGGGTTSRDWTFSPSSLVEDTPKTFTVEQGSSVRAHKMAYGLVTGLSLEGSSGREEISLSGDMIGRQLVDGITLTASPTSIPLVPVLPAEVSVYLDTTSGGLGTTKLTKVLAWKWEIADRYGPLWAYDAAQSSFVEHLETEPKAMTALTVEANSQGMALLANLRANDRRFLRIEAIGQIIEAAITYKLRIDQAVNVTEIAEFKDEDGVYATEFSLSSMHDTTWAKAMQLVVTNTATAL